MRVSTVAIYTLAALAAQELSHQANATSSLMPSTKEAEDSDFFATNDFATPELTKPIAPPETLEVQKLSTNKQEDSKFLAANNTTPRELKKAIAPPETLDSQPFAAVAGDVQSRQNSPVLIPDRDSSFRTAPTTIDTIPHSVTVGAFDPNENRYNVVDSEVSSSALSGDIFTPHLEQIRKSLPPGWVMRLPSQVGDRDNLDRKSNKYIVGVSPSTSEPGLTVSIFNCQEQRPSCLVGSFAVAAKTSIDAQKEFKKHHAAATAIALANNIQGYLLEDSKQKTTSAFSSVMWEQDNQFYTVKLPAQSRHNLIYMASSMADGIPIQSTAAWREVPSANSVTVTATGKPQAETQDLTTTTPRVLKEPVNSVNPNVVVQATREQLINDSSDEAKDRESSSTSDGVNPSKAGLLQNRHPALTTAEQLRQGEVVTNLRYRQSFPPDNGRGASAGLTGQPSFGISWGVTDNLELTLDSQTVDNGGPFYQGPFQAQRINPDGTGPNFFQEFTLQAKQRIWQNEEGTQALSGVVAASLGNAGRPYRFFESTGPVSNGENKGVVTSLELPVTIKPDDRWQFTLSPKVAFLPEDNALYFNRPPIDEAGSFGTTFGLAGGVSYRLNPRLQLWGDAFVPLTGNNTINRDTGLPAKTVAFNAGLRYLVNPRLATDLFVSNTLGNTGPLSIVADRNYPSVGLGITYLPGITSANRRYPQHFGSTQQPPPDTSAGFGLLDGGTIPNKQVRLSLQGGEQGLLTGVRYGLLDDLEIGAFLDSIPGTVDESQLGLSGKIRFLHQADGDPFTLSGLVTVARSNNVLVNLINNDRNKFEELGLEKGGFAISNEKNGELFILTLSTPMQYQFKGGSAIWLTPTLGFIQRNGLQVAGVNFGGSVPIVKNLDLIAEAGLELSGKGNAFIGDKRGTVIPWTVGLRWQPASFLGISDKSAISGLQLEAYVTNRLGTTPFDSLRVRADNDIAVGAGLVLPIQF